MKTVALLLLVAAASAYFEFPEEYWACTSSGDPHLRTFDNWAYDFHNTGWHTYVKTQGLVVSVRQDVCAGTAISCVKDVIVETQICDTSPCTYLAFGMVAGVFKMLQGAGGAVQTISAGVYATRTTLPGTSTDIQVSASQFDVWGVGPRLTKAFHVTMRASYVAIALGKYSNSLEGGFSWGTVCGLCGTPDGNVKNELANQDCTPSSFETGGSWHTLRTEIAEHAPNFATGLETTGNYLGGQPTLNRVQTFLGGGAVGGSTSLGTWSQTYDVNLLKACDAGANYWSHHSTDCTNTVKPICDKEPNEDHKLQCLLDYRMALVELNDKGQGDTWSEDRARARSFALSGAAAGSSILIGLLVGGGLGLIFVVAAVAFFAKNPELLPFTHKKNKVQKELKTNDVLK